MFEISTSWHLYLIFGAILLQINCNNYSSVTGVLLLNSNFLMLSAFADAGSSNVSRLPIPMTVV
jgi:hypothetical protein